jgi:dihydroflavonol-4-reductase
MSVGPEARDGRQLPRRGRRARAVGDGGRRAPFVPAATGGLANLRAGSWRAISPIAIRYAPQCATVRRCFTWRPILALGGGSRTDVPPNVELGQRAQAAAAGAARMVYTSSGRARYQRRSHHGRDHARDVVDMIGHKRSKFLAEEAVRRRARELGYPVVTVNPSTPIGPGDIKPTPTGRILLDAAAGRMPAFVDTGLNLVHVDDVARGHLLAHAAGVPGERYILGGEDFTLQQILELVAAHVGRRASTIRLPHWFVYPIAFAAEGIAKLTKREPRVTLDGVRMSTKHMYFSSLKAERELGYRWRDPRLAIAAAVDWFKENDYF